MNRRSFVSSALAVAALCLVAGCRDDGAPIVASAPTPQPPMQLPFAKPTFITCDPAFSDYRPAVDSTGTNVVFERTPYPNPNDTLDTTLYLAANIGTACQGASPFLASSSNLPNAQTRPDWSWTTGQVAFSGAPSNNGTSQVYVAGATGGSLTLVPRTVAHIYPIWTSNAAHLVVYDNSTNAMPVMPVTALIDALTGEPVVKNLNGNDASNVPVFGGFAAPQPGNPTRIAFAGQPALASWGAASTPATTGTAPAYNQDNNYVFLNSAAGGQYTSAPLEPAASISAFDPAYQGRAPYWSPNGQYIVFESSRAGGYALFLANVAKVAQGGKPVQLTDSSYWSQHAKFLPGGTRLVFTALQTPSATNTGPRGIAIIDISAFLN